MATSRKSSMDMSLMKNRIKELEDQVSSYKKRLDELRKAKNTTVLKTEQRVLEVNAPNLGQRNSEPKIAELQQKMDKIQRRHQEEQEELVKKHQDEISQLKRLKSVQEKNNDKTQPCDHPAEIEKLQSHILTLEGANTALLVENRQLQERVESLVQELSVKEATWCEQEEILNQKLKRQWGEKYAEWMAETEKKIEELQTANNFLRGYLKKHEPKD